MAFLNLDSTNVIKTHQIRFFIIRKFSCIKISFLWIYAKIGTVRCYGFIKKIWSLVFDDFDMRLRIVVFTDDIV